MKKRRGLGNPATQAVKATMQNIRTSYIEGWFTSFFPHGVVDTLIIQELTVQFKLRSVLHYCFLQALGRMWPGI